MMNNADAAVTLNAVVDFLPFPLIICLEVLWHWMTHINLNSVIKFYFNDPGKYSILQFSSLNVA